MVSAVGSGSANYSALSSAPSTAGLDALLVAYKKELSACVNCATAETPSGKAAIEVLNNKIRAVEARREAAKLTNQSASAQPTAATAENSTVRANPSAIETLSATKPSDPSKGSLIDLFT